MGAQENKHVVQEAYAAFGRGDIATILKSLTDDVEWHGVLGVGPKVPTGGTRKGHEQVAQFFEQVGATVDFKRFEPKTFLAEGETVVVLGEYDAVIKPTGRRFAAPWVMVFRFRGGKVAQFQEFTDSYGLTNAY